MFTFRSSLSIRAVAAVSEKLDASLKDDLLERPKPWDSYTRPLYNDEDVFEAEQKQVFEASWACVGSVHEFGPGAVRSFTVGTQPLFVTRAKDGKLRAFKNVCRHRASQLVHAKECQHRSTLICHYHRWCYALDGRLLAAPLFQSKEGGRVKKGGPTEEEVERLSPPPEGMAKPIMKSFDRSDFHLFSVRLDTLGGLIFVNVDGQAPPLDEYLGCATELMAEHAPLFADSSETQVAFSGSYQSKANWKLLLENSTELFQMLNERPMMEPEMQRPGMNIVGIRSLCKASLIELGTMPDFPKFSESNHSHAWFHAIFPNVFYFCLPHLMYTVRLEPTSCGSTVQHVELLVHKKANNEEEKKKVAQVYDEMMLDSIEVCEAVQKVSDKGEHTVFSRDTLWLHKVYADFMAGHATVLGDNP